MGGPGGRLNMPMYFKKNVEEYRKHLLAELSEVNAALENAPEGEIQIHRNGTYWKWRHYIPADTHAAAFHSSIIPKNNAELAERLCAKHELLKRKELLIAQLNAIEQFINHYPTSAASSTLDENEEYKRLLSDYHKRNSIISENWLYEPYEKSTEHPEGLIIPTDAGILVRSKSEALIANELYDNNIPFHYEQKLSFGGFEMYPDFTIMNPSNNQLMIWEHFGLIDSDSYKGSVKSKLSWYLDANYIPDHNLILTYEAKGAPLSSKYVKTLIRYHFSCS